MWSSAVELPEILFLFDTAASLIDRSSSEIRLKLVDFILPYFKRSFRIFSHLFFLEVCYRWIIIGVVVRAINEHFRRRMQLPPKPYHASRFEERLWFREKVDALYSRSMLS